MAAAAEDAGEAPPPPAPCDGVTCEASSACKVAGTCQDSDGQCSAETDAADGTACDDDDPMMVGTGQIAASLSASEFAAADPEVGTDETISVEVMNTGNSTVNITGVAIGGTHADDFELTGAQSGELSAGAFHAAVLPREVEVRGARARGIGRLPIGS